MSQHIENIDKNNNQPRDYFGALDGFRGALALVVAVYHTAWASNINSMLNHAQVLVDLFFVFSGFLMFWLYQNRLEKRADATTFMKRRFARIYPLHFFVLILFVLFHFARFLAHQAGLVSADMGEILPFQSGSHETLGAFFAHLTLTHSMGIMDGLSYNVPSWTISVEFFTYIVFALIMLFCPPHKRWHFILIGGIVGLIYLTLSRLKPNMDFHYDLGFWRCLGGFLTGLLAAKLYGVLAPTLRNGGHRLWASCLELFTMAVLIYFVFFVSGRGHFFLPFVAALFVLTFAIGRGFVSFVMSRAPLLYLGKISYSIYMIHMLIAVIFNFLPVHGMPRLMGADWNAGHYIGDWLLIPYLLIVILVSHFTYIYVEKAGQRAILAYQSPNWARRLIKNFTVKLIRA